MEARFSFYGNLGNVFQASGIFALVSCYVVSNFRVWNEVCFWLSVWSLCFILMKTELEVSTLMVRQVHVSKAMLASFQEYWVHLTPTNCQVCEHYILMVYMCQSNDSCWCISARGTICFLSLGISIIYMALLWTMHGTLSFWHIYVLENDTHSWSIALQFVCTCIFYVDCQTHMLDISVTLKSYL